MDRGVPIMSLWRSSSGTDTSAYTAVQPRRRSAAARGTISKNRLDASLQERVRKYQARRQAILIELANLRQRGSLPLSYLKPGHIHAFSQVLREKLLVDKGFAKQYVRLLVADIRLEGNTLRMTGSYAALPEAVAEAKTGTHGGVPTFASRWLPDQGSNLGPAD